MYICVRTHVCMCVYMLMHVCISTYTYVHTCEQAFTCLTMLSYHDASDSCVRWRFCLVAHVTCTAQAQKQPYMQRKKYLFCVRALQQVIV